MNITEADRATIADPRPQAQEVIWQKVRSIEAVEQRGEKIPMSREVAAQARKLGVSTVAVNRWIALVKKHGITGLIEGRVLK